MQELLKAVAAKFKPNQLLRTVYVKSPSPGGKRHERQATGISARRQRRRRVAALKARRAAVAA
jgi:ribosomal protein S18